MKSQSLPEISRSTRLKPGLIPLESEIISVFVQVAETLSLPRSLGEIYGLLFCAKEPLCFDDIVQRLQISGGSTSQGLKFLRHMGAIRVVYQPKDRRDFFVAETGLRSLAGGILKQKLEPALTSGSERLARMESLQVKAGSSDAAHFAERIAILRKWHHKSSKIFPLVLHFLK
jgi:DNA-binding transcriptional regulator GbsR (MarR family)